MAASRVHKAAASARTVFGIGTLEQQNIGQRKVSSGTAVQSPNEVSGLPEGPTPTKSYILQRYLQMMDFSFNYRRELKNRVCLEDPVPSGPYLAGPPIAAVVLSLIMEDACCFHEWCRAVGFHKVLIAFL